jgi:hypothetical protein
MQLTAIRTAWTKWRVAAREGVQEEVRGVSLSWVHWNQEMATYVNHTFRSLSQGTPFSALSEDPGCAIVCATILLEFYLMV